MGRAPCCDKGNVKRGPWSPEEDHILKSYIHKHGTAGNWIALPQKIGLKRCGKSCRLRWLNYLRPNIKHGGFTQDEDTIICSLYVTIGSRWSIIAAQLPGRTDNDIKNYWNTRLKKKLFGSNSIKESFSLYPQIEPEFCYDDDQGRIYEAQYQFGIDFPPLDGVPHVDGLTPVDVGGSSTMSSSSLQNLNATSIVYPQSAPNNYEEICYQEIMQQYWSTTLIDDPSLLGYSN